MQYLQEGDANMSFFHHQACHHKQKNYLPMIQHEGQTFSVEEAKADLVFSTCRRENALTHGKPEGSARWSQRSAWLQRRDNRSYVFLPRRASQFNPVIDKERKFISNLRWNMPVCAQIVPSLPLGSSQTRKATK